MYFTTRKAILVLHFTFHASGVEREKLEDLVKAHYKKDVAFLQANGYMQPDSIKLTHMGQSFVNSMLNANERSPIEAINFHSEKAVKKFDDGLLTAEEIRDVNWDNLDILSDILKEDRGLPLDVEDYEFVKSQSIPEDELVDHAPITGYDQIKDVLTDPVEGENPQEEMEAALSEMNGEPTEDEEENLELVSEGVTTKKQGKKHK